MFPQENARWVLLSRHRLSGALLRRRRVCLTGAWRPPCIPGALLTRAWIAVLAPSCLLASPLCGYALQYEPSVRLMPCILVYCASTVVYSREESTFLPPSSFFPCSNKSHYGAPKKKKKKLFARTEYNLKTIECMIPRKSPKVNYVFWVDYDVPMQPILVSDVSKAEGYVSVWVGRTWEISMPSSLSCCKHKSALKNSLWGGKKGYQTYVRNIEDVHKLPNKELKSIIKYILHQNTHDT